MADVQPEIATKIASFGDELTPAHIGYDVPAPALHNCRRTQLLDFLSDDDWLPSANNAGIDVKARIKLSGPDQSGRFTFDTAEALWLFRDQLAAEGASAGELAQVDSALAVISLDSGEAQRSGTAAVELLRIVDPGTWNLAPSDRLLSGDIGNVAYTPIPPGEPGFIPIDEPPGIEPLPPMQRTRLPRQLELFLVSLARGILIVPRRRWSGTWGFVRVPLLDKPRPALFLIEEYLLRLSPDGFGLGRSVRVATFLPGETLSMPVMAWRPTDGVVATTIADSFSIYAADAFSGEVLAHVADAPTRALTEAYGFEISRRAGFSPLVEPGVTTREALQLSRSEYSQDLLNALREHISRASAYRATLLDTPKAAIDDGIDNRVTSNVNLRRALTAVFRELNQRYSCELRLIDVRVGFSNGRLHSWTESPIAELSTFVGEFVADPAADAVVEAIVAASSAVTDHSGREIEVIEAVDIRGDGDEPRDLARGPERRTRRIAEAVRHPGALIGEYKLALRTGSVLGEVLIGQADGLDRYALALQAADAEAREVENDIQKTMADALTNIPDPATRVDKYADAYRSDGAVRVELDQTP